MFFNRFGLKSRNINIIGFSELILGFLFFIPIAALYLEQELFTVTNVALIFAIQSISIALLEIPTGAFADLFGRKNSYIFGQALFFLGIVFLYIGGSMSMFILSAIATAAGNALVSGADRALIYDTLKQEKKERHFKHLMSILSALWPLGAIAGSVIGGFLAKISLSLPILLSLVPLSISLIMSFFLKEPSYEKDHKKMWKQMFHSSKLVVQNWQLIILMLGGMLMMAFGETTHQLKPLFLEFKTLPIEYFGIVFGATFALSSLGHFFSHHVSDRIGNKKTILLCAMGFPAMLILATMTSGIIAVVFLVLTAVFFGLRNPVVEHMLHVEIPSSKRATILSINNLLTRAGMALGAPFIGYFADLYTINTAFAISGGLMCGAVVLFAFLKEQ
ncbi:MAG: MFS transporter [Candidatus Woesearchaeota archaeon]|nr:MFS transporter [Candidatus Woesearchaeota archaeon]